MMEIELNQRGLKRKLFSQIAAEQRKEKEATKTITKKYKKRGEALALVEKELNKIVIEVVEKAERKTELRKSRLMTMWREIEKKAKDHDEKEYTRGMEEMEEEKVKEKRTRGLKRISKSARETENEKKKKIVFKTATLDLWLEKKVLNDDYPPFKDFPSKDMAESTEYTGEDVEISCQEESESAVEEVDMLNQDRLECAEMEVDIPSQDMAENYDDMLCHECGDILLESEGKLCTKMYEQFRNQDLKNNQDRTLLLPV